MPWTCSIQNALKGSALSLVTATSLVSPLASERKVCSFTVLGKRRPLRFKENIGHAVKQKAANELKKDTKLVGLLRNALQAASDESGWAHLSAVGSNIAKQTPEFDPRNYGFSKLGELAEAIKLFDVDKRIQNDGHSRTIYIRDKSRKTKK